MDMSHKLEGSGANHSIGRLTATTLCRAFCMALLAVGLTAAQLQAATWVWNDVSGAGNWSDTTKWAPLGSYPNAQAAVADFSQVDLTADETVTLDAGLSPNPFVTLGSLVFGNTDASPAANWTIAAASSANYIQLDNTGGTGDPSITVNNLGAGKSATIHAQLSGTGFTKLGVGTLTLSSASNNFGGTTTLSAGTLNLTVGDRLGQQHLGHPRRRARQ